MRGLLLKYTKMQRLAHKSPLVVKFYDNSVAKDKMSLEQHFRTLQTSAQSRIDKTF